MPKLLDEVRDSTLRASELCATSPNTITSRKTS